MLHTHWTGTHYEAGLAYGKGLAQSAAPLDHLRAGAQRSAFAAECLPLYQKYAPALLEEIQGIADGLGHPFSAVGDFLLSMYCFMPAVFCSAFAFSGDGAVMLGRNSDFMVSVEPFCDSPQYRLDGAYAFLGNTTLWTQMEDGVNEHGLAAGLTFLYPTRRKPGFNAGMLVRYLLENCRTVGEALEALHRLPIGSAQTITLADREGRVALAECNCEKVTALPPRAGAVYAANHFVSPEMTPYQYQGRDDIFSHRRYGTLENAFRQKPRFSRAFAEELLSGKHGFLCQYDRAKGMDTVWSVVYDLSGGAVYRAEGNPARTAFRADERLQNETTA